MPDSSHFSAMVSPRSDVWWKNHLSSIRCFVLWHVRLQRVGRWCEAWRGDPPRVTS
jgi:hypothetical protein